MGRLSEERPLCQPRLARPGAQGRRQRFSLRPLWLILVYWMLDFWNAGTGVSPEGAMPPLIAYSAFENYGDLAARLLGDASVDWLGDR